MKRKLNPHAIVPLKGKELELYLRRQGHSDKEKREKKKKAQAEISPDERLNDRQYKVEEQPSEIEPVKVMLTQKVDNMTAGGKRFTRRAFNSFLET